jgi:hypothetical protein
MQYMGSTFAGQFNTFANAKDTEKAEESFKDLYSELLGRVMNVIENPDDRARFCVNNFED